MLQTSTNFTSAPGRRRAAGSAALALLGAGMACAGLARADEPAWRELRDAGEPPAQAAPASSTVAAARGGMAGWKPVKAERLDDMRGGFDVGSGLQVSFGIERAVYVNGALVVATSISIPDVSRITAEQATRLAETLSGVATAVAAATGSAGNATGASGAAAGTNGSAASNVATSTGGAATSSGSPGASSVAGNASATGASATSTGAAGLPATVIATATGAVATNGLGAVIQNGPGNSAPVSLVAGGTVIQNTLNNQSIRSLMTIDASVNTLQAFRAQIAGATLHNALLQAASMR